MQPPGDLPTKEEVANALLAQGTLFMHLDPRVAGVVVPPWHCDQAQLVLQLGLQMPIPIPDLRIDQSGLSGTLSFNRSPFYCQVPWDAVFALAGEDGRGMVWPESMPPEIEAEIEREAGRKPPIPPTDKPEAAEEKPTSGAAQRRPLPPYLKIIK